MFCIPSSISLNCQRDLIFANAPGIEATETLLESVTDLLFCVKDRTRSYIAANGAFIRHAGLNHRSELLGRRAAEVFPAVLAAGYEQQDDEVFSKGTTIASKLEMITRQGGKVGWFVSQKVPVKSAAGEVIALAGISRDLGATALDGGGLGALAEVVEMLQRDFAKPLRIEELARRSGLSSSQFQRRVREITGLTPRQLLSKSRIEAAAHALRTTDVALSAIALDCGFYDQAAFSHQFSAATGLSPGEYRRALRESRTLSKAN